MADAVVSSVVGRLTDMLLQERKHLGGVRDQVEQLQSELNRMRCFLKDADARQDEREIIRNWVSEIREAAYDAEDIIETFALKVASTREGGLKKILKRYACILDEAKNVHKVGSKIEKIKGRISGLATSLQAYGVKELTDKEGYGPSREKQREMRQSFPHVEQNIVGLEDSIKELVSALVDNKKTFSVMSICGIGGLGKTTLATKMYHHSKVRDHFDSFAWVYISQQYQRRDIWLGILLALKCEDNRERVQKERDRIQKLRDQELADELHGFLKQNKCLVIIDDIWSIEAWNSLEVAFPKETSSKILLTSRKRNIALHADPRGFLYEPRCLNDEESWELLQRIAFSRIDNLGSSADFRVEERMKELGKQMARHCAGLPLAIKVLGGLLMTKPALNQWQTVHENIKTYITKGIGFGQDRSEVYDQVFVLSYDELPLELKQCFLYFGHFPEDYEISAEKLIKFWIGDGLIIPHEVQDKGEAEGRTLEDVAECYLDELIERSMVLVGRRNTSNLKIITCRMHDIMRDLCLYKAQQERFLQVINLRSQDQNGETLSSASTGKFRRLAIHVNQVDGEKVFNQGYIKSCHLRSLLYLNGNEDCVTRNNRSWNLLKPIFKGLKLLRVLNLEGAEIKGGKLPRDVGKLIHLRFLSLQLSNVSRFPSSLGNLRLLEILDLRVRCDNAHVPNVIWKMKRLRRLYLPKRCDDKTRLKLDNLTNLVTLVNFQVGNCNIRDLIKLENLRELSVHHSPKSKCCKITIPASLSNSLKHLQYLRLGGPYELENDLEQPAVLTNISEWFLGYTKLSQLVLFLQIEKLPDYQQFPSDVASITLGFCKLEEDPMPILEKLPNLRTLALLSDAFVGRKMVCSRQGFSQLHLLGLSDLHNLEDWKMEEGAMPNIRQLHLDACKKLKRLPDRMSSLTTLKELNIFEMPKAFKNKLNQGGEDFYKVQHVPSINFLYCDEE